MERRGPTSMFGYLRFDNAQISIRSRSLEVTASRDNIEAIHVQRCLWSARVRLVFRSGYRPRTYFAASTPGAVVAQLQARGWPVIQARRLPRPAAPPGTSA